MMTIHKPRLAIVENKRGTRERLRRTHESPPASFQKEFRIGSFDVETAVTVEEARDLLLNSEHSPFDVLLLDLGLPIDTRDLADDDNPYRGIEILRALSSANAAHPDHPLVGAVVGASAHGREGILEDLMRTRMVDGFVRKPWDEENRQPFAAVVDAYRLGQQRQWERYKQHRLMRCFSEAAKAGVGRLARVVTNCVSEAIGETRQLIELIEEELHLSVKLDCDNPLCRQTLGVQNALMQIAKKCAGERDALFGDDVVPPEPPRTLAALLEQACNAVRSGFCAKVIQFECETESPTLVATSPYYARMVLEEICFGAIDTSATDQNVRAEMTPSIDGRTVAVSVSDHGQPLLPDQVEAIHRAETGKLAICGRAWGLALAQYVALNIGGRLEVATSELGSGNCVTLYLPVKKLTVE